MMRNNCYVFVQLIRPRPVVMWQEYRAFKVRFSSFLYSSTCKLLKMTLKCWLLQAVYIHILPVSPLWGQGLLDVQLSCTRSVSSCVAAFCYKILIIAAVFDGFSSNWGGASQPSPFHLQLNFLSCQLLPVRKQVENWEERKRAGGKTNVIAVEEMALTDIHARAAVNRLYIEAACRVALWHFACLQNTSQQWKVFLFDLSPFVLTAVKLLSSSLVRLD